MNCKLHAGIVISRNITYCLAFEKMTEHNLMMLSLNSWLFLVFVLEEDLLGLSWNLAQRLCDPHLCFRVPNA